MHKVPVALASAATLASESVLSVILAQLLALPIHIRFSGPSSIIRFSALTEKQINHPYL